MKTKKTPTGVIEYYDNFVIKRLDGYDQCINLDWLKHYQAIANRNNFLVKVHRVVEENTAYEMEKLDVVSDVAQIIARPELRHLITRSFICKLYEAVNTTWVDSIKYSDEIELPNGSYFLHGDMALKNILLLTDGSVKIGDPESFHYMNKMKFAEGYAIMHTHLMFALQRFFREIKG